MEPSKLNLKFLSENDLQWRYDEDHPNAYFYKFLNRPWQKCTKTELDAIDTRLYPVLDKLTEAFDWGVSGRHLCRTVEHWLNPKIQLPPISGTKPQYIERVVSIDGYDNKKVKFTAIVVTTNFVNDVEYVSARQSYLLNEDFDWLEKNYPGAKGRVLTGIGMEMPQEELIQFVFSYTPEHIPTINITGLDNML